ncbi:hypothetical protein [Spiroplasma sp. AdecLV25b]|uniref:ABC transporter permease n=1 Tax=Spiroplasma sp. AdecLV25b TaxID=3027162 RepID=UPI0027E185D4|nr:hypothetical protein [Spiroplasma sp. AdecLV25b]
MLEKSLKVNWKNLFYFIMVKITHSFITNLLFIISIVLSFLVIVVLFSLNLAIDKFLVNIQYYIMILYGILLFIFVLMNAIKLFGTQVEDSSFLLLLTKPYSRRTIILTQYLALFSVSFVFITLNILVLLIVGGIMGGIIKEPFLVYYIIIVLKFFAFLSLFTILVTTGTVTILSFAASQTVFLIFIIFCSLFLLGGLPYTAYKNEAENITLNIAGNQLQVKEIKDSILFDKYVKEGLIKYPDLSKALAEFYHSLTESELQTFDSTAVQAKRIDFFTKEELIKTRTENKTATGNIQSWKGKTVTGQVTVQVAFTNPFISLNDLKTNLNTNFKKDLFNLINDYDSRYKLNNFITQVKFKMPKLIKYDLPNCKITTATGVDQPILGDEITNAFLNSIDYRFDSTLRESYNNIFNNPVYFIIRATEDYIYGQVNNLKIISNNNVSITENYLKLQSIVNTYNLINKVNFIEHWNQIWTYFMGFYGDFWFSPLTNSNIDFDTQQNTLFSYPDFDFTLSNGKFDIKNLPYIQNSILLIAIYMGISVRFTNSKIGIAISIYTHWKCITINN